MKLLIKLRSKSDLGLLTGEFVNDVNEVVFLKDVFSYEKIEYFSNLEVKYEDIIGTKELSEEEKNEYMVLFRGEMRRMGRLPLVEEPTTQAQKEVEQVEKAVQIVDTNEAISPSTPIQTHTTSTQSVSQRDTQSSKGQSVDTPSQSTQSSKQRDTPQSGSRMDTQSVHTSTSMQSVHTSTSMQSPSTPSQTPISPLTPQIPSSFHSTSQVPSSNITDQSTIKQNQKKELRKSKVYEIKVINNSTSPTKPKLKDFKKPIEAKLIEARKTASKNENKVQSPVKRISPKVVIDSSPEKLNLEKTNLEKPKEKTNLDRSLNQSTPYPKSEAIKAKEEESEKLNKISYGWLRKKFDTSKDFLEDFKGRCTGDTNVPERWGSGKYWLEMAGTIYRNIRRKKKQVQKSTRQH